MHVRSKTCGRMDVWLNRRPGACASEILVVGQSSNVGLTAISGKLYFHHCNFYFRQHHYYPEKIYLLRIFFIGPASISVKERLFSSKQHRPTHNSLHLQW